MNPFDKLVTFTRTDKTIAEYRMRYAQFDRDAKEAAPTSNGAQNEGDISDEEAVVNLFLKRRYECQAATERKWRAAIMFVLDEQVEIGNMEAFKARRKLVGMTKPDGDKFAYFTKAARKREAIEELEAVRKAREDGNRERRRSRKPGNTSVQKAKAVAAHDISLMVASLDATRSKWKRDTRIWFQAAMLTGLRPSEWAKAALETDHKGRPILRVANGKNTNGRANGRTRTLVLEKLNADQLFIVRQQVESASSMEAREQFVQWFDACRMLLQAHAKALWPKRPTRPTLYTARHLFAANAKNALTRREVAALMGHGSELTAGRHYARKRSATGSMDVSPSEQDIAALISQNGDLSQAPRTGPWREAQLSQQTDEGGAAWG